MFKFVTEKKELEIVDGIVITDEDTERIEHFKDVISDIESKYSSQKELIYNHDTHINYGEELNSSQLEAVVSVDNPVLIIAGAGSGKTRTLTYRVAYMIENGIPPENILLLTFTRKAANEMVERTRQLLAETDSSTRITAGTFHAFANNILRRYSGLINIIPNFTILDSGDCEDIIDLVKKDMEIIRKGKAFPRKKTVASIISRSRSCELSVAEIIDREYPFADLYLDEIVEIKERFTKFKKDHDQLDYDDLLETLLFHLENNITFKDALQYKYRYIMVDEFQDTNKVQNKIVNHIADKYKNIMVVGDDTQSIYAFRGADFENILKFPEAYPDCRVIKLEQNYRSKQDILDFTNKIINNFKIAYKKKLFSENNASGLPKVKKCYSASREAEWITQNIIKLIKKGEKHEDIAVLYRATFHGSNLQSELIRNNIDFVVYGGLKFTERRHVKDIIGYLRVLQNHKDAVSWNRILKIIPGIGTKTASKIIDSIVEKNEINAKPYKRTKFYENLEELIDVYENVLKNEKMSLNEKVASFRKYYEPLLKEIEPDFEQRLPDLKILEEMAGKEESLEKFLTKFALDPPSNKLKNRNTPELSEEKTGKMTLSTIHSAKGLEWKHVFVIGLLDGLFPSTKSSKTLRDVEEERRLFYVACTRAKDSLILTHPGIYFSYDQVFNADSRFISEMG